MTTLIWQTALLLLCAYFLGAWLACMIRRTFFAHADEHEGGMIPAHAAVVARTGDGQLVAPPARRPDPKPTAIETIERAPPHATADAASRFEQALTGAPKGSPAAGPAAAPVSTFKPASAAPAAVATPVVTAKPAVPIPAPAAPVQIPAALPIARPAAVTPTAQPVMPTVPTPPPAPVAAPSVPTVAPAAPPAELKPVTPSAGVAAATAAASAAAAAAALAAQAAAAAKSTAPSAPAVAAPAVGPLIYPSAASGAGPSSVSASVVMQPAPAPAPVLDDLTRIRAIDSMLQGRLKALGVTRYRDIASWLPADIERISKALGFTGRIEQENWIEQAQILARGGETDFARRKDRGLIASATPTTGEGQAKVVAAAAASTAAASIAEAGKPSVAAPVVPKPAMPPVAVTPAAMTVAPAAVSPAVAPAVTVPAAAVPAKSATLPQVEARAAFAEQRPVAPVATTAPAAVAPAPVKAAEPVKPVAPATPAVPVVPVQAKPAAATMAAAAPTGLAAAAAAAAAAGMNVASGLQRDNLQRISGINAEVERLLHVQGVTRYSQIASWSPTDAMRIDRLLGHEGRVTRESWIDQALLLSRGGDTAYSRQFDQRAQGLATNAGGDTQRPGRLAEAIKDTAVKVAAPVAATTAAVTAAVTTGVRSATQPIAATTQVAAAPVPAAAPPAPAATRSNELSGLRSVRSEAYSPASKQAYQDDLKRIRGVGVLIEKKLNSMGVHTYAQVANWSASDIDRVSQVLDFKGRIERENWVEQARILSAGGQTEFSRRVDRGEVETSKNR